MTAVFVKYILKAGLIFLRLIIFWDELCKGKCHASNPDDAHPIARKQAGFHDATISKVASATAIRQSVFQQEITQYCQRFLL